MKSLAFRAGVSCNTLLRHLDRITMGQTTRQTTRLPALRQAVFACFEALETRRLLSGSTGFDDEPVVSPIYAPSVMAAQAKGKGKDDDDDDDDDEDDRGPAALDGSDPPAGQIFVSDVNAEGAGPLVVTVVYTDDLAVAVTSIGQ